MKQLRTLIVILFLTSCAAKTKILMPEYKGQTYNEPTVSVVIDFDKIFIDNEDDVLDDLGKGDTDSLFSTFFKEQFSKRLPEVSNFKKMIFNNVSIDSTYQKQTLNITKHINLKLNLPSENTAFSFHEEPTDFIIFIDKFKVWRYGGSAGTWMAGANGTMAYSGGSNPYLEFKAHFAIWDVTLQRLVSYGISNAKSVFMYVMDYSDWDRATENMAVELVSESPFKKKYRRHSRSKKKPETKKE